MTLARESLTYETFTRLRRDIIEGRIRPNERLIAADLAESLGISRTPVREALQLLEAEDIVVGVRRGYVVREHTKDEVVEIYEVRAALEGMAARLVAQHHDDATLASIVAIGAHDVAIAADRSRLVDLNSMFHAAIIQACGNRRLGRLNSANSQQFFNYRIAELYTDAEAIESVQGHARIVEALQQHDADEAESAAQQHVLDGLAVTLSKLR